MIKICVFAGTGDGRKLIEFLSAQKEVLVTACTATEYGGELLHRSQNLTVLSGKMPEDEISSLFCRERFDLVIDATHPYARSITESILQAAEENGVRHLRMLREESDSVSGAVCVGSTEEAAEFLENTQGTILLATGSKEIGKYSRLTDFARRVYARVLPVEDSLKLCRDAGLEPDHIIAMKGPFSEELNTAMLKHTGALWMVTKDGGSAGGFEEKLSAAQKAGAGLVIIGRPKQHEGLSYQDTVKLLINEFGFKRRCSVVVAGVGPGNRSAQTEEVKKAFREAECIIGAARMLDAVSLPGQAVYDAVSPEKIAAYIREQTQFTSFAVAMSGDTGFYSGTKKLLPLLGEWKVKVLPGLSSLSVLCARLGVSYEDVISVSLHGRDGDISGYVRRNEKVFTLVGGEDGVNRLCRSLIDAGLGYAELGIGERLSYPEEKITEGTAQELVNGRFESLSAVFIYNPSVQELFSPGIRDNRFLRGEGPEGVVPMTKREVRAVCMSMLEIRESSTCWDIGAGTGSVSVEMALQAYKGHVYAVERKDAAADLIEENKKRFGVSNITVVKGLAPEACRDLPDPDCVFIGGSCGNMKEILKLVKKKNPKARIIAAAVTLESAAELTSCIKEFGIADAEVVSLNVSRNKKAGSYNLMTAQNPVYIFSIGQGE